MERTNMRTVPVNGDLLRRRRNEMYLSREKLLGLIKALCRTDQELSLISLKTLQRAEKGEPLFLSSAKSLAKALGLSFAEITGRGEPATAGVYSRNFDPFSDDGQSLLDSLRELHPSGGRLRYFHRSLPYQL